MPRRRFMTSIVLTLFIVFVALFFLVKFLEATSVFYPGQGIVTTPAHAGIDFEDLYFKTSDGVKINAWFVKGPTGASTVILAHGNAGTMSERVMKVKFLHDLGLNVLMFDYRGYGLSQGKPSERGIYLDAQGAYDYLKGRTDVDQKRIIGYGISLGGTVMIDLAIQRPLAAIMVDSSITSAKDMAKRLYPMLPYWMMSIKFDSISKIKKITVPKLFMHSPQDQVVPYSMGEQLYQAAAEPKEFLVTNGGHNDFALVSDLKIKEGFRSFLHKNSLL